MDYLEFTPDPQRPGSFTATAFRPVRFEYTTPDGRQFLTRQVFWATMEFHISPGPDPLNPVSSNPLGHPGYGVRYYLDGQTSPSNNRGPFHTPQEAKNHASTMAYAWGYSQKPDPHEQTDPHESPDPVFVSQQMLRPPPTRR